MSSATSKSKKSTEKVEKAEKVSKPKKQETVAAANTSKSDKKVSAAPENELRNVTLITTGYRTRVRDESIPYAEFAERWLPKSQQALHEEWEKRIGKIKEESWVSGAGEHGIFSRQFGDQCVQIADPENTYAISTGLGLVCMAGDYPQYDLGAMEADIRNFDGLDKKLISDKQWWMFVCDLGGMSIFDATMTAIKRGHRVIWAATGLNFFALKLDTVRVAELPAYQLAIVRQHLRIVGPELDPVIHPKLLPCVMPYDRAGLDRCVPGSRANGVRRAAFLLQHVSPTPENGRSSPREDAERMAAAYRDESFTALEYRAPTQASGDGPKHQQIDDDEVLRLIKDTYLDLIGPDSFRIARMMREDGYWVRQEKVEELLARLTKTEKVKAPKSGNDGGGNKSKSAKSEKSEKGSKPKSKKGAAGASASARAVQNGGAHVGDKDDVDDTEQNEPVLARERDDDDDRDIAA